MFSTTFVANVHDCAARSNLRILARQIVGIISAVQELHVHCPAATRANNFPKTVRRPVERLIIVAAMSRVGGKDTPVTGLLVLLCTWPEMVAVAGKAMKFCRFTWLGALVVLLAVFRT